MSITLKCLIVQLEIESQTYLHRTWVIIGASIPHGNFGNMVDYFSGMVGYFSNTADCLQCHGRILSVIAVDCYPLPSIAGIFGITMDYLLFHSILLGYGQGYFSYSICVEMIRFFCKINPRLVDVVAFGN